jgi:hypothetical protein
VGIQVLHRQGWFLHLLCNQHSASLTELCTLKANELQAHFSAAWSRTGRKGPYAAYYVQIKPGGGSFVGKHHLVLIVLGRSAMAPDTGPRVVRQQHSWGAGGWGSSTASTSVHILNHGRIAEAPSRRRLQLGRTITHLDACKDLSRPAATSYKSSNVGQSVARHDAPHLLNVPSSPPLDSAGTKTLGRPRAVSVLARVSLPIVHAASLCLRHS